MTMTIKGGKLVIEVDVSAAALQNAPMSSTGKSRIVASTSGFRPVDGHPTLRVGLNVITR